MPEQNQQTTNRSSRVSQAREELTQLEFEGSYDERVVEDQEGYDPGKPKDLSKLKNSLRNVSDEPNSSGPVSERSGGIAGPLTEEEVQRLEDLY